MIFKRLKNLFANIVKKVYKLIISLVIPQLAGGIGAVFTSKSVGTWYKTLERPGVAPPNWIFGPVWTLLFLLMGISLFLVWKSEKENKKTAFWIFAIQLFLNVLWSIFFFGFHSSLLSLLEIVFLWISIILNIIIFSKISRLSAWLLVPYLLWVTFAAFLNFSIWKIN